MAVLRACALRSVGEYTHTRLRDAVAWARTGTLAEARGGVPAMYARTHGAVLAMDLERVEERYLLVGDSRAGVYLFDTQAHDGDDGGVSASGRGRGGSRMSAHAGGAEAAASSPRAGVTGSRPAAAAAAPGRSRAAATIDSVAASGTPLSSGGVGRLIASCMGTAAGAAGRSVRAGTELAHEMAASLAALQKAQRRAKRKAAKAAAKRGAPPPPEDSDAAISERMSALAVVEPHTNAVSTVKWYPADTGMFLTGGFDQRVLAWDTARFEPAFAWNAEARVNAVAMSPIATRHTLAAVCTSDPRVRLLDLAACGFAHVLNGHTGPVVGAEWCPGHEHLLATASMDGTVRVWDVRRSGATALLSVLDWQTADAAVVGGGPTATGPSTVARFSPVTSHPGAASKTPVTSHLSGVAGLLWLPLVGEDPHYSVAAGASALTRSGVKQPVSAELRTQLITMGLDGNVRLWNVRVQPPGVAASAALASNPAAAQLAAALAASRSRGGAAAPDPLAAIEHVEMLDAPQITIVATNTHRAFPGYVGRDSRGHGITFAAGRVGGRGEPFVAFVPDQPGPQQTADVGVIRSYDIEAGEAVGTLRGHQAPVNCVLFKQSTQELFSGSNDRFVVRWTPRLLNGEYTERAERAAESTRQAMFALAASNAGAEVVTID